ncbi:MAG TPA: cytochrome-c oxidase, cbb3-type subunit II [Anaeromyxobacteraceae bacterium]|nr:cytochrome-c oxidase, cbb3-type subunit II [Anaeromyxobacteraceae bacterium]
MAGTLERKPILFTLAVTVAVLVGSIVMMAYPMLRPEMHPKLEGLRPYTPLQLAGRDVYQREGCVNCHTQTVRPLRTEVMRYGDFSKAGEFYYDHPFLWGSKRTGPDLAREGGKRPDSWHLAHYADPQKIVPRSNMPAYPWLAKATLDAASVKAHMDALGMPYTKEQLAELGTKTEMDALVAYTQQLGHAVAKVQPGGAFDLAAVNPFKDSPQAIAEGAKLWASSCSVCHGDEGHGGIGPSITDGKFLGQPGYGTDGEYFAIIAGGSDAKKAIGRPGLPDGGMEAFAGQIPPDGIWRIVAFIRAQQKHEAAESPGVEKREHETGGKH